MQEPVHTIVVEVTNRRDGKFPSQAPLDRIVMRKELPITPSKGLYIVVQAGDGSMVDVQCDQVSWVSSIKDDARYERYEVKSMGGRRSVSTDYLIAAFRHARWFVLIDPSSES